MLLKDRFNCPEQCFGTKQFRKNTFLSEFEGKLFYAWEKNDCLDCQNSILFIETNFLEKLKTVSKTYSCCGILSENPSALLTNLNSICLCDNFGLKKSFKFSLFISDFEQKSFVF